SLRLANVRTSAAHRPAAADDCGGASRTDSVPTDPSRLHRIDTDHQPAARARPVLAGAAGYGTKKRPAESQDTIEAWTLTKPFRSWLRIPARRLIGRNWPYGWHATNIRTSTWRPI